MSSSMDTNGERDRTGAPESIRILHVGPGWGQRGGIASVLSELVTLKDQFRNDHVSISLFETHGFQSVRHALSFLIADVPHFVLTLIRGVDIVHFHVSVRGSFYRKLMLFTLAKLSGRKTIFHLHAGNFERFESNAGKMSKRAIGWFIRRSNATVAVSRSIADELRRLGAKPSTLHVIGNTACLAEQASQKSVEPGTADDSVPYVAFAGRLTEAKGLAELLKAIALLGDDGLTVALKLAGGGDIERWKQLAIDYGIDDRVSFVGWLDGDEKLAFYRNARVFCMPSYYESFGISTLEAMFAGIPVVGTRLGGFLDLVEEGETGFLVKANDPEALAARIRLLMVDDSLARAMGTAARRRAIRCFSMEHTLRRYVNCYREISQ